MIARIAANRHYLFASPAYAALFGAQPSELVGRSVRDVVGDELYRIFAPGIDRGLRGERVDEDVSVPLPGGTLLLRAAYEPEIAPDGTVSSLFAMLSDVSEQRRTEQALRESEVTLRAFYDSAPVCMGVVEVLADDIRHVYDNVASCRFFGVAPEQTRGRLASQLGATAATIAAWRAQYLESAARGAPVRFEHASDGAGGRRWLSVSVSPLPSPSSASRFCYVADDITAYKLVQQELAAREEAFRLLADNISQFAWMADANGWIYWYNQRWFEYTGTTLDEMQGWGWRAVHHPDHVDRVVEKIRHCFASGEPWEDIFPLRGRDGAYRWYLSRAIPIRDANGAVLRWFGTNTDITAQRDAEQVLRDTDRQKDEFLAVLAHELRNPLSPIRNAVEVMRLKAIDDPDIAWSRDVVQRQLHHLARLVDDLLDVARISRGRLELRTAPLELATVVAHAIESSRPQLDERRHHLSLRLTEDPLPVAGDEVRLTQILTNLLNNSAKYSDPGSTITLETRRDGDAAVVTVRDTGIGISSSALPHIFDMFRQGDGGGEQAASGLGIGLTLVRKLVEMHGGTVTARSDGLGRGSEFDVRLPLLATSAAAAPERAPAHATRQGLRILVADDNQDSADSLALLLELRGHTVETAYDGRQALAVAQRFQPDVALLDLGMPELSGHDVCRELRALPFGAGVCIIALTGWGQEDERERTRQAGFDHHLVKPVEYGELARLLDRVL